VSIIHLKWENDGRKIYTDIRRQDFFLLYTNFYKFAGSV